MRFTLSQSRLPTTLVSTASTKRMKSNIAAVYTPLSPEERRVSQELRSKFFSQLKGKETWVGAEVMDYWRRRETRWAAMVEAMPASSSSSSSADVSSL